MGHHAARFGGLDSLVGLMSEDLFDCLTAEATSKQECGMEMESLNLRKSEILANGFARFMKVETNESTSPLKRGRVPKIGPVSPLSCSGKGQKGKISSDRLRKQNAGMQSMSYEQQTSFVQ